MALVEFRVDVINTLDKGSSSEFIKCINRYSGSSSEKRPVLDQVLRDVLLQYIKEDHDCIKLKALILLANEAVFNELCSPSTPFLMLADIFDTITLERCETMFELVADNVETWKMPVMFEAGKNFLLRMSNDLLRRLSKSFNTVFCGRIQLFLARLFPLSEKSALNLMSNFNTDNITLYTQDAEEVQTTEMDVDKNDEMHSGSIPVDYSLYRRFWALQSYFSKPTQCYEKVPWKQFVMNADVVLKAFDSYKLEDSKPSTRITISDSDQPDYFSKYLTNQKLLNLQLNDSNFRRYILVQFLILFQYLNANVKFKGESLKCTEEQTNWIKVTETKVFQLLRDTPPEGEFFAKAIKHILERENNWNNWKNEGCASFIREKTVDPKVKPRVRKRSLGEDIRVSGTKITKMGNPELTRLWNINSDNLASCQSEKRIFLPSLSEFFADAIEQADPANMVEDEYKLVHDEVFQWRALRLLARRSPYFFTPPIHPSSSLSGYLESMLNKIAVQLPNSGAEEVKTQVEEGEDELKEGQEDDMKQEDEEEEEIAGKDVDLISEEVLDLIGDKLGSDWRRLATELNFSEEDISFIENEFTVAEQQACRLLTVWKDNDGDRATQGALKIALKEVGLSSVLEAVWGSEDTSP